MPWAEQREFEFIDDSKILDSLNYPCDTEYLKDPVWVVKHNLGHLVAAVVYDGTYGMFQFKYLTGGEAPKELSGLFRSKQELIDKAKKYLSTITIPFEEEALETPVEEEKVEEVIKEAKELQGTEELNKAKEKVVKHQKTLERRAKKKAERKRQRTMFSKVEVEIKG